MTYKNNRALLEKALRTIPLASQTYSKSHRYFPGLDAPHFIEKGEGAYVWDIDGNRFIDFICALGPITVGYNNKEINNAIIDQLGKGIIFSKASPLEYELSEKIREHLPFVEMVRFMKNGSDVTTAAIRLARAFTGKDGILACGYHGIHDWYIGATTNRKGIPQEVCQLTDSFAYNDMTSLESAYLRFSGDVAVIIMEPIQGDGPLEGYLEAVKQFANEREIILVFDEVVSGFRYAAGGATEYYGITPDLITFGKGMANGMPLSAVAGRKDLLELIETENVFISTTFGGECLSLAAAIKTIEILNREKGFEHMWRLGTLYLDGLKKLIRQYGMDPIVSVSGLAPHCGVSFEDYQGYTYLDYLSLYIGRLLDRGIMSVGINNFSLSHNEADVLELLIATEEAFADIKQRLDQGLPMAAPEAMVDPVFKR